MKHIPATFGKITVAHIQRSYLSRLVIIIAVFSLGYHPANGKDWYYNVDVGAAFINGPKTLFFAERDENAPFGRLANLKVDEGEGWGLGVGGTLGRPLDTPLFNAHGSRIELSVFHADQEQTTNRVFVDNGPGERYGYVALDGSNGFGTPDGETLSTRVTRENRFGRYELMLHQDRRIARNRLRSIFGGFSGMHLRQNIDSEGIITLPGSQPTTTTLTESLNTDYVGGKLGLKWVNAMNDNFSASFDTALGFYGANSRYHGDYARVDQFGGREAVDSRQSTTDFSLGLDANFGLTYQHNPYFFTTLFSSFQYLDYAPQVEYGAIGSPPAGHTLRIVQDQFFMAVVGLQLTCYR